MHYGFYDYERAVKDDVLDWIEENVNLEDYPNREKLEEYLNETLWDEDSVTGNGSGSYTFDRAQAGEYLSQNFDLLYDALKEFDSFETLGQGPEACDVSIRCYLLPQAISEALHELGID